MHLKQLKAFWIFIFILAISSVNSESKSVSKFNFSVSEQFQQGCSHKEHSNLIAEPVSNFKEDQDESHRKNNFEPSALKFNNLVFRFCRFSNPLASVFRTNSWEPSISVRLMTSTFRI